MGRRRGHVTFADTSVETAGYEQFTPLPLVLPRVVRDGRYAELPYLTVPLLGVEVFGLGMNTKWKPFNGVQPTVLFDSGADGVFVIDDTLGADGTSILEATEGMTNSRATYILHLGTKNGRRFSVPCPPEWRGAATGRNWAVSNDSLAVNRKRHRDRHEYSQMLVVGNVFMTCLSITFELTPKKIDGDSAKDYHAYFAHLNGEGNPSRGYVGPEARRIASASSASKAKSVTSLVDAPVNIQGWEGDEYNGAVVDHQYQTTARYGEEREEITDVTLPFTFTTSSTEKNEDANARSLPNLPVYFTDTITYLAVFDTGSSTTIFKFDDVDTSFLKVTDCSSGCDCFNSRKTVRQVFSEVHGIETDMDARFLKNCEDPFSEAGCKNNVCCSRCCLSKHYNRNDVLDCAIAYCTGVLAYTPATATVGFSHEKLKRIENVHVGLGKTVCEPLDIEGVIGVSYWQSDLSFKHDEAAAHVKDSSFVFDILSYMGQINGKHNNFTIRIYRTDVSHSTNGKYFTPEGVRDGEGPPAKGEEKTEPDPANPPSTQPGAPAESKPIACPTEPGTKIPAAAELLREQGFLFACITVIFLGFIVCICLKAKA